MNKILNPLGFVAIRSKNHYSSERIFRNIVSLIDIDLVVDVGAHRGEFRNRIRQAGFNGKVISLEPVTKTFGELQRAANADENWEVVQAAAGSEDGEAEINVEEGNSTQNSIVDRKRRFSDALSVIARKEKVRLARLDTVIPQKAPDAEHMLIKSDTQGYDIEVLKGCQGIFNRTSAVIVELSVHGMYENSENFRELTDFLYENGFVLFDQSPVYHTKFGLLTEYDGVFVRRTLIEDKLRQFAVK